MGPPRVADRASRVVMASSLGAITLRCKPPTSPGQTKTIEIRAILVHGRVDLSSLAGLSMLSFIITDPDILYLATKLGTLGVVLLLWWLINRPNRAARHG